MIARFTVDMQSTMIHALAPRAGRARRFSVAVGKGRNKNNHAACFLLVGLSVEPQLGRGDSMSSSRLSELSLYIVITVVVVHRGPYDP